MNISRVDRETAHKFRQSLNKYMRITGRTQTRLAYELGISQPTLSKWLSGQSTPSFPVMDFVWDYIKEDLGVKDI